MTNNVVASGTSFAGGDNVSGNGSKKIVVNDPKLEIQKSVDKLEYKVGDEVTYTVKIKLKDDILNYGETKEIRYSMAVRENANRKRCT